MNVVAALTGPVAGADAPVAIVKYGVEGCGSVNNWTVALAALHDSGYGQVASYDADRLRPPIIDRVELSGGAVRCKRSTGGRTTRIAARVCVAACGWSYVGSGWWPLSDELIRAIYRIWNSEI